MFEKIAIERTLNRWRSTWARPVLLMVDRTPRGEREKGRRRKKRRKSRSPVRPPRRGDVSFRSFATHFLLCPPLFLRFERYSNRPPIYLRDFENAPELSAIRRRKNFGKFPSFEEGNWFTNVGFVFSPLERSEARGKWSVIVLRFY